MLTRELMHWSGERDRLTEEQVALVKRQLQRETDEQLLRSYEIYLRALQLDKGEPPAAATIQYFVEAWRGSFGGGSVPGRPNLRSAGAKVQ